MATKKETNRFALSASGMTNIRTMPVKGKTNKTKAAKRGGKK